MASNSPVHPWIVRLREHLDGLESALLANDAMGIQTSSAQVQTVLQQAPKTAEFGRPGSLLRLDMTDAAHRFGQLRQAVLRNSAHNQRALQSLLPERARTTTYGNGTGPKTGGAGLAYLSA